MNSVELNTMRNNYDGVINPDSDATTTASSIVISDDDAKDVAMLEAMGYKPLLFRGLDSVMNFAFGFTEVAILASVGITFGVGLNAGGPSAIIWGFMTNFALTMIIAYCMAEICSAYPSAGSVYHWAGQLAPEKYAPLCSYVCGWLNFLGNAAGDASFANAFGSYLSSGLIASGHPGISAQDQVGVSIAFLFLWSVLNCFRIDQVGWVNNLAAIVHTGSIFVIIICILALSPRLASASFVFTDFYNGTGFSSHSYVGALGITTALFNFAG